MSLETLSQIGEFVGGIGVILSLVYLAFQVRSNTRSQRADMTARILDRMAAQQHTWMRCSNTIDWWLTFPGILAFWRCRPTPNTDAFTAFVEDRLVNGKGDFNEKNWRSYLVSGQPR